jgi:hypothetical protein
MIVPFVIIALLFAIGAGMLIAVGTIANDLGNKRRSSLAQRVAVAYLVLALLFAFGPLARAADVAEIPGVAVFTDERGECPRLWRIARAPDGTLGCWTIGEIDRAVTIKWPDGSTVEYSELRFEIYAR